MAESFQELDRDGTHLVGYIECDYQTLIDVFGEPNPEHCDGYKTDVEWRVAENSLSYPIAIYNWKNGKNYCGRFGLPVKDIKRWNIGGKNSSDVILIEQVLGQVTGFKSEVFVDGEWASNGVVWPDLISAEKAASDLYSRWTLTTDYRAVEVQQKPNRPTWDVWVAEHGLPPRSVSLANTAQILADKISASVHRKGETDGTR